MIRRAFGVVSLGLALALFCLAIGGLGCATSTSPSGLPPAYEEVIRSEWAIAQDILAAVGVTRVDMVVPELCTWIPHDGPIQFGDLWLTNGVFDPNDFTITWNIHTPGVIHHEAGHAILEFLDHPCSFCWSVEPTVTVHEGEGYEKCTGTKLGKYCGDLL
jgi:hypothetical protein